MGQVAASTNEGGVTAAQCDANRDDAPADHAIVSASPPEASEGRDTRHSSGTTCTVQPFVSGVLPLG